MRSAVVVALAALLVSAQAGGPVALPVSGSVGTPCQLNPATGSSVGFKMFVSAQPVDATTTYFTLENKIYPYSSGDCQATLYATITIKGQVAAFAPAANGTVAGGYDATFATTSDIYTVTVAVLQQNATIFVDAFTPVFKSLCAEYASVNVTAGEPFPITAGCQAIGLPSIADCPQIHEVAQSYNSGASLIFGPFQNVTGTYPAYPCVAAPAYLVPTIIFGNQTALPEGYTAPPTTAAPSVTPTATTAAPTTAAPTVTPTPTAAAPMAATVSVVAVALAAVFAAFAQRLM